MQKKIGLGIVCCVFGFTHIFSQNISIDRTVDWSNAGVQVHIPEFTNTINILNYGGNNNNSGDNVAAFNAALAAAAPGTTILFPAGTYSFNNSIRINKDSIIIKGEGIDTKLMFNQNGAARNLIEIQGNRNSTDYWVSQDIESKQKYALVSNPSFFSANEWVNLLANDSSIMYSTWAYKTGGQILQIEKISGDTLFFKSEFRRSHPLNTSPRLRKINPRNYVGIENLYIERVDNADAQTTNILFNYAVNSWIIGLESNKTTFAHVSFNYSSNMVLRGSYLHHSHSYGSGGRGYGIVIQNTSGECLVENNVFNNLRHSVLLQAGANGNVIGYNYSLNPYWTGVLLPANSAGDIVLHGNYVYSNLIEGNTAQHIVIDNSHGINGPYNTVFRNKAVGYGIFMNDGAGNSTNIVGNDVTNTGLLMGAYTLTGSDNYQYGNRVKGANNFRPAGSTQLTKESHYLCQVPSWWDAGTWPNIGAPYAYNNTTIPALNRWSNNAPLIYSSSLRLKHQNQSIIWYKDIDGDGFGNPNESVEACSSPDGYVANNTDCNDNDANVHPNTIWYEDKDKDGFHSGNTLTQCIQPTGYVLRNQLINLTIDCNDNNTAIHPNSIDICDGIDNNCDGKIDDGLLITFYKDADGDGYGNPNESVEACSSPDGYVVNNTDCNDSDASVYPAEQRKFQTTALTRIAMGKI